MDEVDELQTKIYWLQSEVKDLERVVGVKEDALAEETSQNSLLREQLEHERKLRERQKQNNIKNEEELISGKLTEESNNLEERKRLLGRIGEFSTENETLEHNLECMVLQLKTKEQAEDKLASQVECLREKLKKLQQDYAEVVSEKERLGLENQALRQKLLDAEILRVQLLTKVKDFLDELYGVRNFTRPIQWHGSSNGDAIPSSILGTPLKGTAISNFASPPNSETVLGIDASTIGSQKLDSKHKDGRHGSPVVADGGESDKSPTPAHGCSMSKDDDASSNKTQSRPATPNVRQDPMDVTTCSLTIPETAPISQMEGQRSPVRNSSRDPTLSPPTEEALSPTTENDGSPEGSPEGHPAAQLLSELGSELLGVVDGHSSDEQRRSRKVSTKGCRRSQRRNRVPPASKQKTILEIPQAGDLGAISSVAASQQSSSKSDDSERPSTLSPPQSPVVPDSLRESLAVQQTQDNSRDAEIKAEWEAKEDPLPPPMTIAPTPGDNSEDSADAMSVPATPSNIRKDLRVSNQVAARSTEIISETPETRDQMNWEDESKGPSALSYPGVEDPRQHLSPVVPESNLDENGEVTLVVAETTMNVREASEQRSDASSKIRQDLGPLSPPIGVPPCSIWTIPETPEGSHRRGAISGGSALRQATCEDVQDVSEGAPLSPAGLEDDPQRHSSPVVPDENGTNSGASLAVAETPRNGRETAWEGNNDVLMTMTSATREGGEHSDSPLTANVSTPHKFLNATNDGKNDESVLTTPCSIRTDLEVAACSIAAIPETHSSPGVEDPRSPVVPESKLDSLVVAETPGNGRKGAWEGNSDRPLTPLTATLSTPPKFLNTTDDGKNAELVLPTPCSIQTDLEVACSIATIPETPGAGDLRVVTVATSQQTNCEEFGPQQTICENVKHSEQHSTAASKIITSLHQRFSKLGFDIRDQVNIQFWFGKGQPPHSPTLFNLKSPHVNAEVTDETWTWIKETVARMFQQLPCRGNENEMEMEVETIKSLSRLVSAASVEGSTGKDDSLKTPYDRLNAIAHNGVSNYIISTAPVEGSKGKDDSLEVKFNLLTAEAHKMCKKTTVSEDAKNLYQFRFHCILMIMKYIDEEKFEKNTVKEFGRFYKKVELKNCYCWNALFFGLGACWNGREFLQAVHILRYWQPLKAFQKCSNRLTLQTLILLLICQLNEPKVVHQQQQWLDEIVTKSPEHKSVLCGATMLRFVQDSLQNVIEPSVVEQALKALGRYSEETGQSTFPTPAGTPTSNSRNVDWKQFNPKTPCPTKRRPRRTQSSKRKRHASGEVSRDKVSPTKRQRRSGPESDGERSDPGFVGTPQKLKSPQWKRKRDDRDEASSAELSLAKRRRRSSFVVDSEDATVEPSAKPISNLPSDSEEAQYAGYLNLTDVSLPSDTPCSSERKTKSLGLAGSADSTDEQQTVRTNRRSRMKRKWQARREVSPSNPESDLPLDSEEARHADPAFGSVSYLIDSDEASSGQTSSDKVSTAKRIRSFVDLTEEDTSTKTSAKVESDPYSDSEEAGEDAGDEADRWNTIRQSIPKGDPLRRLLPGKRLNDIVIEKIVSFFPLNSQIQVLNPYFLNEGHKPKPHRLSVDASIKRYLVFVSRYKHWVVLDAHLDAHLEEDASAIYIYDSLCPPSLDEKHWTYSVCKEMAKTVNQAFGGTKKAWKFHAYDKQRACPLSQQQSNTADCGVLGILNTEWLLQGIDPRSESIETNKWRLKWAEEIIRKETKPGAAAEGVGGPVNGLTAAIPPPSTQVGEAKTETSLSNATNDPTIATPPSTGRASSSSMGETPPSTGDELSMPDLTGLYEAELTSTLSPGAAAEGVKSPVMPSILPSTSADEITEQHDTNATSRPSTPAPSECGITSPPTGATALDQTTEADDTKGPPSQGNPNNQPDVTPPSARIASSSSEWKSVHATSATAEGLMVKGLPDCNTSIPLPSTNADNMAAPEDTKGDGTKSGAGPSPPVEIPKDAPSEGIPIISSPLSAQTNSIEGFATSSFDPYLGVVGDVTPLVGWQEGGQGDDSSSVPTRKFDKFWDGEPFPDLFWVDAESDHGSEDECSDPT